MKLLLDKEEALSVIHSALDTYPELGCKRETIKTFNDVLINCKVTLSTLRSSEISEQEFNMRCAKLIVRCFNGDWVPDFGNSELKYS